jgi:Xaa-Pro aminopeptidase
MMVNQELERARVDLKEVGTDWALLSSAENVTYVSHYEVPVDFGPLAHLSYGPVLALFAIQESASSLIANSYYASGAREQTTFDQVHSFDILQVFEPFERQIPRDNFIATVREAFQQAGLGKGKLNLAVEEKTLPLAVLRILTEEFPNVEIVEASLALEAARKTKTEREIELLKQVAEVVNVGHKQLLKQTREAGKTEFELWSAVTHAMHEYVGGKLFMTGELVCGPRNKSVAPGGPIHYVTRPGDLAEFDVSPRLNGYWADMANVMVVGAEPTMVQKKYARAARDSFYAAAGKLRPGNRAKDVFEAAARAYDKHGLKLGHYVGHGIGTTVNEAPWFVPSDETVLEPGMVVCIETGTYSEEATGKCEKMLIVCESGDPEIFPDFDWGIELER